MHAKVSPGTARGLIFVLAGVAALFAMMSPLTTVIKLISTGFFKLVALCGCISAGGLGGGAVSVHLCSKQ
jgi:hypothetical protein